MPNINCHFESLLHWRPATESAFHLTQAHLWKLDLTCVGDLASLDLACLSPAEMTRANRFIHESDRLLFLSARVATRNILAGYLGQPNAEIEFMQYGNGKPSIGQSKYPIFDFNIAHSGSCVLIAVAPCHVGVDVERINPAFDPDSVLGLSLSASEVEEWRNSGNRLTVFYKFWTRKEAILKMNGIGIVHRLTHIPAQDGHHQIGPDEIGTVADVNVVSFLPCDSHIGSLCLPAHIGFSCWLYW